MARKSSITTQLAPEDIDRLNAKLGEGRMTIADVTEWLEALGYEISWSAVQRYGVGVKKMAESLRQSRQVTEALVAELGDAAALGKQGRLLVEVLRSLVFDLLEKIRAGDEDDIGPKEIMQLSRAVNDLSRALRLDQDYEAGVQKEAERKARADLAQTASETMKEAGMSDEQVRFWREKFLGVKKKEDNDSQATPANR